MYKFHLRSLIVFAFVLSFSFAINSMAQQTDSGSLAEYEKIKKFELQGKVSVNNLILRRDRAEMSFTGDFYFAVPINGRITGAVFIGTGTFRAVPPSIPFEVENMRRFLSAEAAESDFRTAVLRFSDNTFDLIGKGIDVDSPAPNDAQKLASELGPTLLKETGINIPARLLVSIDNKESAGVFLAQFDKGKRNRFTYLLDPQARLLGSAFGINGGEKVILFRYDSYSFANDVWMATYSQQDLDNNRVSYSDQFDVVIPIHYQMEIDLREPRRSIRTGLRIDFESTVDNLRALPMLLNDNLPEYDDIRLKRSMRIKSAQYEGKDILFVQEDWESGLTLVLPKPMQKGDKFSLSLMLEGDFIDRQDVFSNCYYPQDNESWYPRHGYLKRSTFDLTFRHRKKDRVSSIGSLIRETDWPDAKDERLTQFKMDQPVAMATFAAGMLERHTEKRKLSFAEIPLEFYSVPSSMSTVKETFILAELGNALNYYSEYFGPYPYTVFGAAIHPFNFGQGFPTRLFIPPADEANNRVFSFIAHETAHQWWGHMVAWRSYRDQWLSEGFAEYSGILYTGIRDGIKSQRELIKNTRHVLPFPPKTNAGVGAGKVAEIGPLILGRRLASRNTQNAYQTLIYNKGALVVRMLHFLFSDPSTGSGQMFFNMMGDFVKRYQNRAATTEEFMQIAGAHFAQTPIAKTFGLKDLNWFFQQWVYETSLPSYQMEYSIEPGQNGQFILTGSVIQENSGKHWFMPLPIIVKFPGGQEGRSLVYANGPQASFKQILPMKPDSVELDPDNWVLSEKTTAKKK